MECVLAWHLYDGAVFKLTQLFVCDVSYDCQANAAVSFCVAILQNVFFSQRADGFGRGWRRPVSVWVVLHNVLYYVLDVLFLATSKHLE